MFTAEIIEDPIWSFANKQVSVSAIVSIKNGDIVIDTKGISFSISIFTEGWYAKGLETIITKATNELTAYQANYTKVLTDTGFASPALAIADLKTKLNTALAGV